MPIYVFKCVNSNCPAFNISADELMSLREFEEHKAGKYSIICNRCGSEKEKIMSGGQSVRFKSGGTIHNSKGTRI